MSTISSVQASGQFQKVFLEPFHQGALNIKDGLRGKRTETILVAGALLETTRDVNLSLVQRVAAVAVGALLLVPIVNAIAMAILKLANSNYLYAPVRQPINVPQAPVIPNTNPFPNTNPSIITPPEVIVPVVPLTPEQMAQRKTEALARLGQLEAMGAGIAAQFEASQAILTFDLDAILQRFPANQNPSQLCNFLGWAGVANAKHNQFRQAVEQFDNPHGGAQRHIVIKDLLSRLNSYFVHRRANVVADSAQEAALKAQYSAIVDKIIDSNRNCVDQVLSQVQEIMLDVAGDMVGGAGNAFTTFQVRAGHTLCNYRTNLLKEICVRQNPTEHHMADLERLVMQRLAPMLGIDGTIFNAGAQYGNIINDADAKIQNAAMTFLNEYKPLEYLTTQIRTNGVGPMQKLRLALNSWGMDHYAIESEDADAPQPATDMNARLSADFDADAFHDFENGAEWSVAGTFLILETTGLIRAR